MNEKLIENIVSDCGYEALGLYSYLYSIRDSKYNISVVSKFQIANQGSYFNNVTLLESINELKEFGYLIVFDNMYFFPKTEEYKEFFCFFNHVDNVDDLFDVLKANDEVRDIFLKFTKSNHEDQEMGMNTSGFCQ